VCLRIGGGDGGSGHTPVHELRGATVRILGIVRGGDPHGLTVREAGCLREGETHRSSVGCLRILQDGGEGVNPPRRGHQSRSAIASRRCWRDTSSLRMARFSLAVGFPSHSHSSSWKEVRSSKAVAMVPSSMRSVAVCFGILQGRGARVNTPARPETPQHRPHRRQRSFRSRCGSHPTDHAAWQRVPLRSSRWCRSQGW